MNNESFTKLEIKKDSASDSDRESFKVSDDHTYILTEPNESQECEFEVSLHTQNQNMHEDDDSIASIVSNRTEALKMYKYQCKMYKDRVDNLVKISEKNQDKIKQLAMIIRHLQKKIRIATVKKKQGIMFSRERSGITTILITTFNVVL